PNAIHLRPKFRARLARSVTAGGADVHVAPVSHDLDRSSCVVGARVSFTDRTGQTVGVRYQYTGPVWSKTGRYRSNSNLNSKNSVQLVRTGIPAGLTGLNLNPNLKSHV